MARSSTSGSGRRRWRRRSLRLAALAAIVGGVGFVRSRMLERDQRQFDERYRGDGST